MPLAAAYACAAMLSRPAGLNTHRTFGRAAMPLRGIRLRGGAISPCGAQYAPLCAAIVDTIRHTFALTPYSQTATSSTTPKKTEFHSISARDIRFACSKFKKIHKNEIFLDLGAICG